MTQPAGRFVWYELLTSDADAACAFYGKVVGWSAKDSGLPGMEYRELGIGGVTVGGLMTLPADAAAAGMRPGWLAYLSVADVDEAILDITGAGGSVVVPATDIANVGRFALLTDPQGAAFYVMTPAGEGESTAFSPGTIGHGGWNELHAADGPAALAFYSTQFGWRKTGEMDMGPMGTYIMFDTGGDAVGGMMTKHTEAPPHWLYYFNVDDIAAAVTRVTEAGGAVLNGPHQVPGGLWIIQGKDPQGAMFALVSSKNA
jgi:predicted enzyme related to lactoylglutathione lyase